MPARREGALDDRIPVSLKRNLAANYLGQAWVSVMGLVFLPLYIKYLGNEALGLIGLFTLMQAWLALLDLGITPTLNREMARFTAGVHSAQSIADLLRSLEAVGAAIAFAVALMLWAGSGYLAQHWLQAQELPIDVVGQALSVMGLVLALRFFEGIYRGALLGLQRQVLYNGINAFMATARFMGAAAVVAFMSPTVRAFYLWQAVVSIAAVLALGLSVHRQLPTPSAPPRLSRTALREVQQFAGGMLAITCLALLVSQVDKLLLSRLLPLKEFGYYTLAATLAGAVGLAVTPILQSIYPQLVTLVTTRDQPGLAATYHQGCQLVAVMTVPPMLVLTIFPWGAVYAWSGQAELAAQTAPLLLPLALGAFLNALMWMPVQSQLAHGWTGLTIKTNLVAVVMVVPALLSLVPRYGAMAAAWIWVGLNAGYVLVAIHFMHRRILQEELRRWYFDDIAVPLCGAVITALVLAASAPSGENSRWLWGAYLGGVGAVTGAVAIGLANALRGRAWRLVRRLSHL